MLISGTEKVNLLACVLGACFFYAENGIILALIHKKGVAEGWKELIRNGFRTRFLATFLIGGCAAFLSAYYYRDRYEGLTVFLFLALLEIVAFVDGATMEIPDRLVTTVFLIGLLSLAAGPARTLQNRLMGTLSVSILLLLLTMAVPGAFGGGDIKLMAAGGFFLGWRLCLLSMAFAVLTGGAYGIWLMAVRKKNGKEHFAFGPFLCLGMAAALFWGEKILGWYFGLLTW